MIRKGTLKGKLERTAISPVVPLNERNHKSQYEGKNRGPEDIKAELLSAAFSSIQKTATMTLCNLSFSQMERYRKILISKNLLSVDNNNGKTIFTTTERGRTWLEQFRKLRGIENGADIGDVSYIS